MFPLESAAVNFKEWTRQQQQVLKKSGKPERTGEISAKSVRIHT